MEDKQYYYRKLDEIYGLVYSTKLSIEMLKREKPEISKNDVETVKNRLIQDLNKITNYEK